MCSTPEGHVQLINTDATTYLCRMLGDSNEVRLAFAFFRFYSVSGFIFWDLPIKYYVRASFISISVAGYSISHRKAEQQPFFLAEALSVDSGLSVSDQIIILCRKLLKMLSKR
jgi:hypothetical protein